MKRLFTKTAVIVAALVAAAGCRGEDPLTVAPESLTLHYGEKEMITTNAGRPVFSSEDDYHAAVDAAGLVTAGKVGSTVIRVSAENGNAEVPVTVEPEYSLYPDIDRLIGATMDEVSSVFGPGHNSAPSSGDGTMWGYTNWNRYASVAFLFEGGRVTYALVVVPTTYTQSLASHLRERYTVAGMLDDYFFLLNRDMSVIISLTVYSSTRLSVLYDRYDGTKASGCEAIPSFDGIFDW